MELMGMGELEFYLLSDEYESVYPMGKQSSYHATAPFTKSDETYT